MDQTGTVGDFTGTASSWDTAFSTSLLISLINSVILATESALFFASVPISECNNSKAPARFSGSRRLNRSI